MGALGTIVSPSSATQPQCKAINQSQDLAYNSNRNADPLGAAISEAASDDTIKVMGTCYGNFVIDKDLTLRGRDSTKHEDTITTVVAATCSAQHDDRPEARRSQITGGEVGVVNTAAILLLTRTRVIGNTGHGIVNDHTADTTVEDSVVSDNGAGITGGFFGFITITNSTVKDNIGAGIATGPSVADDLPFPDRREWRGNLRGPHGAHQRLHNRGQRGWRRHPGQRPFENRDVRLGRQE